MIMEALPTLANHIERNGSVTVENYHKGTTLDRFNKSTMKSVSTIRLSMSLLRDIMLKTFVVIL